MQHAYASRRCKSPRHSAILVGMVDELCRCGRMSCDHDLSHSSLTLANLRMTLLFGSRRSALTRSNKRYCHYVQAYEHLVLRCRTPRARRLQQLWAYFEVLLVIARSIAAIRTQIHDPRKVGNVSIVSRKKEFIPTIRSHFPFHSLPAL